MTCLTDAQRKIAEQLLLTIRNGEKTPITYGDLANRVVPKANTRGMGKQLEAICTLCYELELPLITAKVVQKTTGLPGDGFGVMLERFGRKVDPSKTTFELFHEELYAINKCKEWGKLAQYLHLNIEF